MVLLDWDNRVEVLASYRLRHLSDLFGHLNVAELVALISLSDLVIGVDSGPIHLAGLTRTPSVGVFRGVNHHPAAYCIPHDLRLTVTESASRELNLHKRIQFGIAEAGEHDIEVAPLAKLCAQMVSPCRYLPQGPIAADVQLQQFVSWCKGGDSGMLSHADKPFDILLRESVTDSEPNWVRRATIHRRGLGGRGLFHLSIRGLPVAQADRLPRSISTRHLPICARRPFSRQSSTSRKGLRGWRHWGNTHRGNRSTCCTWIPWIRLSTDIRSRAWKDRSAPFWLQPDPVRRHALPRGAICGQGGGGRPLAAESRLANPLRRISSAHGSGAA